LPESNLLVFCRIDGLDVAPLMFMALPIGAGVVQIEIMQVLGRDVIDGTHQRQTQDGCDEAIELGRPFPRLKDW